MKKVLLPLIAVCCMVPVAAFASHPLVSDSATTVEEKHVEAETALEYHMIDAGGAKAKAFVIQETVTLGVIPKVDFAVTVPYSFIKPDGASSINGVNDITLAAKWNFIKAGPAELAIKPLFTLPTGDDKKGLGEGKSSFGGVLAASAEVSKQFDVIANLGVVHQLAKSGGKAYNTLGISVAGELAATSELKLVAEVAGSKADLSGAKWETKFTAGAIYALQKNIDVDFGVNYGQQDVGVTVKDFGILAGVTFKF